jgi:hypothetical protein
MVAERAVDRAQSTPEAFTSVAAVRCRLLAALSLATVLLACDADEKSQSPIAQVLTAIVRDAADQLPPGDDPEDLPVVYVISGTDASLPSTAQAAVANAVNGEIDVRFADGRDEAVDDSKPGVPVRDQGGLVAVGHLSEEELENGEPVEIDVELYRSEGQFSWRRLTFASSSDGTWSVTTSSVLEELDVPPTTEGDEDAGDEETDGAGEGAAAGVVGTA